MISPIGASPSGPIGPSSSDGPKEQVESRLTQLSIHSEALVDNPNDASMKTLVQGDMAFIKRTMNEAPAYTFTEVQFDKMHSLDQNVSAFVNNPTQDENYMAVQDVFWQLKQSISGQ